MTDRDLAIRVENLSKRFRIPLDRSATLKHRLTHWRSASRYRSLEALLNVSFEVRAGEFVGIIGHNGSGKSTLLKILSRIYRPDAGVVTIEGRVSPFLELGVGFNPELTARENIFLSGAILGLSRPELHRRLDEIIGFAELEQFVDHKLKNFSSGMQVRLAFSLAIQAHAEILMMDEVLAVGDAPFQQKCFDTFNRYKREGRTVVLVTHELGAVTTYCDRALLLDHGRLVADGDTADVTAQYRHAIGMAADGSLAAEAEIERWGSRDVVITGVRMLDPRGVQDVNPPTGGSVRIELGYEIPERRGHRLHLRALAAARRRADPDLGVRAAGQPVRAGRREPAGLGWARSASTSPSSPCSTATTASTSSSRGGGTGRLRPPEERPTLPGHRQTRTSRRDRAGWGWSVVPRGPARTGPPEPFVSPQ